MNDDRDMLERLTRVVFDIELARLRARAERLAERERERHALADARRTRREALAEDAGEDLAFSAGRDSAWQAWLARRDQALRTEVAMAAADREEQRLRALRAFGRMTALHESRVRIAAERRQRMARRAGEENGSG